MSKREGPDFRMRLGEQKAKWQECAKRHGFKTLAGWIKWIVEPYIKEMEKEQKEKK